MSLFLKKNLIGLLPAHNVSCKVAIFVRFFLRRHRGK